MVEVVATGGVYVDERRRFEDYTSMKQRFRNSIIEEVRYIGYQLTTAAAAEVNHTDDTIAFLEANALIFAKSNADAGALDGKSIFMDYVSSTGVVHKAVETKLDSLTNTSLEVAIGCKSGTYLDVIASIAASALTMTDLDCTVANDLAGKYIVGSGAAPYGYNQSLLIASNTATAPTVITTTTVPNAGWDDDSVCIVDDLYDDVYRIRRLWSNLEAPTDNHLVVCDFNGGNLYGVIQDLQSKGCAGSRYFAPGATVCDSYLGYIKCKAAYLLEGDATVGGFILTVTYTPKAIGTGSASDITLVINFNETLDWQPCIQLEPCTDVIIKINKVVDADHTTVLVESCMLEDHSLGKK